MVVSSPWGGLWRGRVDATRFIGKSKQKSKTTRLKPLFTALGVGPALPRLPSAALIADCVSPAQERRAGAAGTAHWTTEQHSVILERGAAAPSTPAPRRH